MTVCVVVANSSRAKIMLAEDARGPLTEYMACVHPQSRLREQDLVSDGSGSGADSGGPGKHSMGHERETRPREAEKFARQLTDEIEKIGRKTDLRGIYLVAPPKFLGLLRKSIGKQYQDLLRGEVNNDLVLHSDADIRSHLPKLL